MTAVDQLLYGQNWEDSALEIEALDIRAPDRVIAVAGAGCTALALLAHGPQSLHAVDRNIAQLHLLRLKLAAICHLPQGQAAGFLGGVPADQRLAVLNDLLPKLDRDTASFWELRSEQIVRGVISQGRVERFFEIIRRLLRLVHSRRRIEQAFAQATLDAQRRFYAEHWDTAGWRGLFLLAHKRILDRVLDPAFYRYVDGRGLSRDLRERAERCMTTLPIRSNYFLSWILRGRYGDEGGWAPVLSKRTGVRGGATTSRETSNTLHRPSSLSACNAGLQLRQILSVKRVRMAARRGAVFVLRGSSSRGA